MGRRQAVPTIDEAFDWESRQLRHKHRVAKQPVVQPVFFAYSDDEPFETATRFHQCIAETIDNTFDAQRYCVNCNNGNHYSTEDFKTWEVVDCIWCHPTRLR